MKIDLILGLQWGDEGKGKIVDVLTNNYDIIARFQGGPNAGHTLEFDEIKHVLHTIPSGIFHDKKINVIGNGVVIDPVIFKKEIDTLKNLGVDVSSKLFVSRKAHLIFPTHRLIDQASELSKGKKKIGSTLKGIGPTYMDKTGRNGFRVGELEIDGWENKLNNLISKHERLIKSFNVEIEYNINELKDEFLDALKFLKSLTLIDSEHYFHTSLKSNKKILAEGAQGSLLDIDFGTYPYVTSSNTTSAGACTGLGIPPNKIGNVYGIFKAYTTRVGSGPFPTELFDETGERIGKIGHEFGATTGRARRCGWLDLVSLKHSINVNGVTELIMMKGDVLSGLEKLKICTKYRYKNEILEHLPFTIDDSSLEPIYEEIEGWNEDITQIDNYHDLPDNFKKYVTFLEKNLELEIKIVSVGPNRKQTIIR
ncbi:MAG: adenylosuccinate synthase [Flavobacteriaceae bacterium]|jgi:adenylosuccinate synthase|nr:adenylosuccinate synthase [Flavobacteriaceae bacterium]MBL6680572.1 adenylosuccinate synthase [Flavobacteriaceae bacterium]